MKQFIKSLVVLGLAVIVATSAVEAKKPRKLPAGAYIKSAKIHIISGKIERYPEAIAMLDSLFLHYGPHAEGLYWMGQINVDYVEKMASPVEKKQYIEKLVAYSDSLHMCCDNEDIKKKYRKNCDKYIQSTDSIRVKYWREFYNAGVEQLTVMTELQEEIDEAEDPTSRSYLEANLKANMDSCVANMELAITIDPTNHKTYIGIGRAYEKGGDPDEGLRWQEIGFERVPEDTTGDTTGDTTRVSTKASMSLSIGNTYISMDKYCEAIPYLQRYLADTVNLVWLYNLSICHNNCNQYEEAMAVYYQILEHDPNHMKVLTGVGRYFNDMGRRASDSARVYQEAKDATENESWLAKRDVAFDSSRIYFKRAFQTDPTDEFVADMYALISALRQAYDDAAEGYAKLTELHPDNADYWTYLGDVQIRLKDFDQAILSYEQTISLEPDKADIWEQLADLYQNQRMPAKESEARKKVKELKP